MFGGFARLEDVAARFGSKNAVVLRKLVGTRCGGFLLDGEVGDGTCSCAFVDDGEFAQATCEAEADVV